MAANASLAAATPIGVGIRNHSYRTVNVFVRGYKVGESCVAFLWHPTLLGGQPLTTKSEVYPTNSRSRKVQADAVTRKSLPNAVAERYSPVALHSRESRRPCPSWCPLLFLIPANIPPFLQLFLSYDLSRANALRHKKC